MTMTSREQAEHIVAGGIEWRLGRQSVFDTVCVRCPRCHIAVERSTSSGSGHEYGRTTLTLLLTGLLAAHLEEFHS